MLVFVRFTDPDGQPVTINPAFVMEVSATSDTEATNPMSVVRYSDGSKVIVRGDVDAVTKAIAGTMQQG